MNLIRAQTACCVFKSEVFKPAPVSVDKDPARFGAGPQIAPRIECKRGNFTGACANLLRMRQIARVVESAVFGRGFSAKPNLSARVSLDRLDKERARAAEDFFDKIGSRCSACFQLLRVNRKQSAAVCADYQGVLN